MDNPGLLSEQFAALGNAGGASRRFTDKVVPTRGVMASVPGNEWVLEHPIHEVDVVAHGMGMYISRRKRPEAYHPERSHQGAWLFNDRRGTGQKWVYLDHSKQYDNPAQAKLEAYPAHEKALYQIDHPAGRNTTGEIHLLRSARLSPGPKPDKGGLLPGAESLRALRRRTGSGATSRWPR